MKRTALKHVVPFAIAVAISITSPAALHAQRGGAGGRAGTPGRGRVMHTAPPPSTPVPSADHPLPYNFNAVRPAPLLGRGPTPAPFSVPPGYYNRRQPLASLPYGYAYGYAAPDDSVTAAPPLPPSAPPPAADAPRPQAEVTPPIPLPPPVLPNGPRTMYVIPGCYGGNLPPTRAKLPNGCDIAKVHVIRPPQ